MSDGLELNKVYIGSSLDILKTFPDESIDMCITSPPYWGLRDYGVDGQLGLEPDFNDYINNLCDIFDEVKRVLKLHGSCWVNLGDTYYTKSGGEFLNDNIVSTKYSISTGIQKANKVKDLGLLPSKCLVQIPSRFSIEMTNRGWTLRNEITWHKPTCMPTSVTDRFTVDFEKLFFFTKNKKYYFKQQIEDTKAKNVEPRMKAERRDEYHGKHKGTHLASSSRTMTRNKRTVWSINPASFKGAHFATYPPKLIESPIDAGCPVDGVVLDPFFGSGTTAEVAMEQDKDWVGIELNPEYEKISQKRLKPKIIEKKTRDKASQFWDVR